MTIVNHGVAGIYWVGSLAEARGRGVGRAITAAATNAGFDLGAEFASLQASPMGEPVYRAMGYETIYDYRLLLSPAPAPLRLGLDHVHPHDQASSNRQRWTTRVGDDLARARRGRPDGHRRMPSPGRSPRLDPARYLLELARPVGRDRLAPPDPAALPGVGPVDLGMHQARAASTSRSLKAR